SALRSRRDSPTEARVRPGSLARPSWKPPPDHSIRRRDPPLPFDESWGSARKVAPGGVVVDREHEPGALLLPRGGEDLVEPRLGPDMQRDAFLNHFEIGLLDQLDAAGFRAAGRVDGLEHLGDVAAPVGHDADVV